MNANTDFTPNEPIDASSVSESPNLKSIMIEQVATLPRATLLDLWVELHGRPPPKNLSLPILRTSLAFELQVKLSSGYSKRMGKDLESLAKDKAVTPRPEAQLQVGTRLVREWRGRTWTVEVADGGFVMNGKTFDSLSAIAKLITGAHWSGPRFFGLSKPCAEASNA